MLYLTKSIVHIQRSLTIEKIFILNFTLELKIFFLETCDVIKLLNSKCLLMQSLYDEV